MADRGEMWPEVAKAAERLQVYFDSHQGGHEDKSYKRDSRDALIWGLREKVHKLANVCMSSEYWEEDDEIEEVVQSLLGVMARCMMLLDHIGELADKEQAGKHEPDKSADR